MSKHHARIEWQRDGAHFTDHRYSRRHAWRFDGGATVPASSSPHIVPPPGSDPSCVDPEEAFVAALSSCHMLFFLSLAAKAGWVVESYVDEAHGVMAADAGGRLAITTVTLRPAVAFGGPRQPSHDELTQLHHAAHDECFLARSVKAKILCEPVIG